jgi:hypothetical protein
VNDAALYASASAVNDTHFVDGVADALLKILLDNARNILRLKGVEIDEVLDWDDDGFAKGGVE